MTLSIIIPTYNETGTIGQLLSRICPGTRTQPETEIIVSDASDDNTADIASRWPVRVIASPKGRAAQMNRGAQNAKGSLLYFLHADTLPPSGFVDTLLQAHNEGCQAGCFRMTFDDQHWLMQSYGWFTRLPLTICRGGDQSLFVTKQLFERCGGFNESLQVMEDIEIIERLQRYAHFHILPQTAVTSARKYHRNGRIRLQAIFACMHLFYTLGFDQDIMADFYERNIS
ncbi:MAG: TIGR04283 family arsenosugar biosynthesis glycosyltransferase [Prosthecochloris sp.]|nr:TIGR04283 family arsenosugar biosynthesis glycosyltransferase [Prosthecochloris sp.]